MLVGSDLINKKKNILKYFEEQNEREDFNHPIKEISECLNTFSAYLIENVSEDYLIEFLFCRLKIAKIVVNHRFIK